MGAQLTAAQRDPQKEVTSSVDVVGRVVVIDSSADRRRLTAHIVEQDRDMTVVGYADGSAGASEAVARLRADAVVLEVQLPVIAEGLNAISALRHEFPGLAIIVCSFHGDATTKRAASGRGADGYLVKPLSPRELHAVLRSAVRGRERLWGPESEGR